MNRTTYVAMLGALAFLWLVLHLLALKFYFYWTLAPFDALMHMLGGFILTSFFLSLWWAHMSQVAVKILSVFGMLILAVLWELIEYATGNTFTVSLYTVDTILDFLWNGIGGILALLYVSRLS